MYGAAEASAPAPCLPVSATCFPTLPVDVLTRSLDFLPPMQATKLCRSPGYGPHKAGEFMVWLHSKGQLIRYPWRLGGLIHRLERGLEPVPPPLPC